MSLESLDKRPDEIEGPNSNSYEQTKHDVHICVADLVTCTDYT